MKLTNNLFGILGFLASSRADQPIKCPKTGGDVNYIGATWTFHVGTESDKINLYQTNEVCTH